MSAIVSPTGRVLRRTGVFTAADLVADVPLRDPRTLADRVGAWPERAVSLLGLAGALAGLTMRPRRSDDKSSPALEAGLDAAVTP